MKRKPESKQKFSRPSKRVYDDMEMGPPAPRSRQRGPQSHGAVGYCPECDERIAFSKRVRLGAGITCHACDADLEVVGLAPLVLDYSSHDDGWE